MPWFWALCGVVEMSSSVMAWYRTTVGKKVVMGVSGAILFGYLIAHLLGNLQIYIGREAINNYSAFLHGQPALLWGTRAVLLAAIIGHMASAWSLYNTNKAARQTAYQVLQQQRTTYSARTMYISGPLLLFYIVYHIAHLTLRATGPEFSHDDLYEGLVLGFQNVPISLLYIVSMVLLGYHLIHGVWSMFQTLGMNHPRYNKLRRNLATGLTAFIVFGNITIPLSVLFGFVK